MPVEYRQQHARAPDDGASAIHGELYTGYTCLPCAGQYNPLLQVHL